MRALHTAQMWLCVISCLCVAAAVLGTQAIADALEEAFPSPTSRVTNVAERPAPGAVADGCDTVFRSNAARDVPHGRPVESTCTLAFPRP